jgi:hypothetical protein
LCGRYIRVLGFEEAKETPETAESIAPETAESIDSYFFGGVTS